MKEKQIYDKDEFTLFVADQGATGNPVGIDKDGRLIVDNAPFLPVGIFTGAFLTEDNIRQIQEGGFNCVIPYESLFMGGRTQRQRETVLKAMDLLNKYGLKVIFSLYEQQSSHQVKSYDGVIGAANVTARAVKNYRAHPALLAWYISDENPRKDVPQIRAGRELINSIDPHHPTITLTYRIEDFLHFGRTGDIFVIDPYPIRDNSSRSMNGIRLHLEAANRIGIPVWMVLQTFHWGAYNSVPYNTFRYPTEEEMRSMALLGVVYNIRGYLFYSYSAIMKRQEEKDPGSAKIFWPQVTAVSQLLHELAPWFLSSETPPALKVTNNGVSKVDAKACLFNDQLKAVITGEGPGNADAVIEISGYPELRSRFGKTENLGNGLYRFRGMDICSDILE